MNKELIELITHAINHRYAEDKTKPGLVIAYLPEKGYYVSVVRYQILSMDKVVVHQSTNLDLVTSLTDVAQQLVDEAASQTNPIEQLREKLQTSKPNCPDREVPKITDSDKEIILNYINRKFNTEIKTFYPSFKNEY